LDYALKKSEKKWKVLQKAIERLNQSQSLVEGKRDKEALGRIGIDTNRIRTIGKIRETMEEFKRKEISEIIVLMDFDERGNELAEEIKGECDGLAMRADLETRKDLRYALGIRFFEDSYGNYLRLKKILGDNYGKSVY